MKKVTNKSDIVKLKKLLKEASNICESNIKKAENIDLYNMMETLDDYVDKLTSIKIFRVYGEL